MIGLQRQSLPIADATVLIEDALRNLLFERVLFHFVFVDCDFISRLFVWYHRSRFFVDGESFLHNVVPPRNVVVHRLADDVTRLRKPELQRRCSADRSLRIAARGRQTVSRYPSASRKSSPDCPRQDGNTAGSNPEQVRPTACDTELRGSSR